MNKLASFVLILTAGVVFSACSLLPQSTSETTEDQMETPAESMEGEAIMEESTESALPSGSAVPLTSDEVAQHASAEDCWIIVNDRVYDVTPYVAAEVHPGKEAILEGCGKDATELYTTRPMGSGTPHSEMAQELLQTYYLGELIVQ